MTCSICLTRTPELQVIDHDGYCPRCGTDYRPWRHTRTVPALLPDLLSPAQRTYNARTSKLVSNGAGYRDRLVAARLALRSNL